MTNAPELMPCPWCGAGETRIEPQGQVWRGMSYSDPICFRLMHFCEGILPDDYVTNRMEMRGRTEEQCVEAWNTCADQALALVAEACEGMVNQAVDMADGRDEAAYIEARMRDAIPATIRDAALRELGAENEALRHERDKLREALRKISEMPGRRWQRLAARAALAETENPDQ